MTQNNTPLAYVETYGCAQNESDSQKIMGILKSVGYDICENEVDADLIVFNTCAVRGHAEDRVYSNIGALKELKDSKPNLMIAVGGCMTQQEEMARKIKMRYPHVDIVFGTNRIHKLPELLQAAKSKRVLDIEGDEQVHEDIPTQRTSKYTALVSVMYGCNNFCSYCVVPYVRGRERSRNSRDILREVQELADSGCKEITLLGQNVNSYCDSSEDKRTFTALMRLLSTVDGIERIRFATSHPKDISDELLSEMAANPKICKQLHLPFQSGSNKVLRDMNRRYTREHYFEIIRRARELMPELAVSSDVIVGYPTEDIDDFEQTMALIKEVQFDHLYTFIFSPRNRTPAANIPSVLDKEKIKGNFMSLVELQNSITLEKNQRLVGTTQSVLIEGVSKNNEATLAGKTECGRVVNIKCGQAIREQIIGKILPLEIISASLGALKAEITEDNGGS